MSTSDGTAFPSTAAMDDQMRDLEAAARANAAIAKRDKADLAPPSTASTFPRGFLEFSGQCNFFVTIGYLTKEQGEALVAWYFSSGTTKLPPLEGPSTGPTPRMYELLSTAIHFGTPQAVFDLSPEELAGADIGDFFSGLADAVSSLVTTVTEGVTDVLNAGTGLIHAATELVHELHELAVLAA